ncbi:SapC [compost metagenome]
MVAEEKFREMNGDQLRKINQNGILQLIHAHFFSLSLMRDIFGRQLALGKVPPQVEQPAPAEA